MTAPTVGLIGLGNMGSALAANLADAGLELVTHDLAGPAGSPAGARFVDEPEALAETADIVVLSLPDGRVCVEVARRIAETPRRRVGQVVDTSTSGVEAARELTALLGAAGIGHVDAPVSGGPAGARARTLTVMYAGADDDCRAVAGVLAGLSDRRHHVGHRPGMGQALKLANNFLSATALAATSEAISFGLAEGLDMAVMLEVLNASSGRSGASEDKFVDHVLPGTYASGFANTLMAKDVNLYLDAAADAHVPAAVAALVAELWSRFAEAQPGVDFTRIHPFLTDSV